MKKVKILALITAVIAAVLLYSFLNSLSDNADVEVVKTGVITAVVNIPPNVPITPDMLTLTEIPVEAAHKEAVVNENAALGKVSKSEITAGEQLLSSKLISLEGGGGDGTLAYEIKPGMRAISIGVSNLSGLVGMIKPKNTVDIIAQLQYEEKKAGQTAEEEPEIIDYTIMLAENITVLAVDNVMTQDGKLPNSEGVAYTSVTIQVTPEQAMDISMSEYKGQLRLILRSPLDNDLTKPKSIIFDNLVLK